MPAATKMEETLVSRLEETLQSEPSRLALKSRSGALTYRHLDELSARCAAGLQAKLEDRFAPVALMMKHDAPLIAAIVGILRGGGFYFVLNLALPAARLRQIIEEVRPRAIVTDREHVEQARRATASKARVLLFDDLASRSASFSRGPAEDRNLCAIFYTSGSSQRPRALIYTHGGTMHNAANHSRSLGITARDRITLLSPCSAAASASAIFGALLNGACLFPFDPIHEGLRAIRDWIKTEAITIYHSVPSLYRRFMESLALGEILPSIRVVKLGGEPVFASDVDLFRRHLRRGSVLINGLGLTEANGNVCHFHVTHDTTLNTATVPVGKPLDGVEMKLLDPDGTEVTPGKAGEIALRGKYLAPGFWTGDRVQRCTVHERDWFRTGDLGRCGSDGLLEHLGRKDDQLKLHGQWIRIAEIEAALMQTPGVGQAAVVTTGQVAAEKRIIAFVSWKNGGTRERDLRSALRLQLPAYSLPHFVFERPQLPLLPSGKIDRVALSHEATNRLKNRMTPTARPGDALSLQLVRIWQKVLGNDAVGITDNFFALGGDSLGAVTMLTAVEKLLDIDLPTSALLEAPTIDRLAELIRRGGWSEAKLRLVALQLRGTKLPLYCVPGAGSEALAFRELATHLGDDQPCFAFQPQGLDGWAPYFRSVEEMAGYYVSSLRRHQPSGPYYLCGSSLGGVIAFEMAHRLQQEGDEVGFLALLDTYGGEYPKVRQNLSTRQKLKLAIQGLLPIAREDVVDLRSLRKGLTDWCQRRLVNLDLRFNFRTRPLPYRLRFLYLQEVCFAARRRYPLRPLSGKIDLFRVEYQPPSDLFEPDPLLGWNGMASGGIEVHEVPGYHGQHLREPNVAILAQQLTNCLDRAALKDQTAKSKLANRDT